MNVRRSPRSLVIGLPVLAAAALIALGAAQTPAAPGDPLIAGSLVLALGLAAYQYWTYLELQPFREGAVAFGETAAPRATTCARRARASECYHRSARC